jgi:hypothetical protein
MIQEPQLVTTPGDNLEGVLSAGRQLNRLREPGWTIEYDGRTDTMFLRAPHHGPAISYSLPERPEILFRLDVATGELTGVDLEDFRRVLAKEIPAFSVAWRAHFVAHALERVPGLRRLMRVLSRGVEALTEDEIVATTRKFCPA